MFGIVTSSTHNSIAITGANGAPLDAPHFEVAGWVTCCLAIGRGEMNIVSEAVPQLTGHPAQTLHLRLRP